MTGVGGPVMDAVTDPAAVGSLGRWLLRPARTASVEDLRARWSHEVIEARLPGLAAFQAAPGLLNKIRGGLGEALLAGASERVRQGGACDWEPPCAAELLFGPKPLIEIGGTRSEISKPFVLSLAARGQDLIVRLSVFGFARAWSPAFALGLAEALRHRVRWALLAEDLGVFRPARIEIARLATRRLKALPRSAAPEVVRLEFLSAIDAERGSLRARPELFFPRLIRRVALLAPWYEVALELPSDLLAAESARCHYHFPDEISPPQDRDAAARLPVKGGHKGQNAVLDIAALEISGELEKLWPFLLIGETTHVGRGATVGLGRYRIGVA